MARTNTLFIVALASLCCHAALAADPAPNTLTDAEKQAGWKLMFDGTSKGWRQLGGKEFPKGWEVEQDALHLIAKSKAGDLTTDEMYDNFELVFQWKIPAGANSGVKYRVQEQSGKHFAFGIEYQIVDDEGSADNKGKHAAASLYDVFAPKDAKPRPIGQWNDSKILVKGNHIEQWLNGVKVVETEYGSDEWNAGVAKSKFKNDPKYANPAKGHIIIQEHGDEVWVRNMKIREL
jgi:hypothetical protein